MWHTPVTKPLPEQTCKLCGDHSRLIAAQLGVCLDCIRNRPQEALEIADAAHAAARRLFGLPERPPRTEGGRRCGLCVQDCVIGEGERGFCGLREVQDGKLHHLAGTPNRGLLHWYRDPLPTNCVADPVCAGHTQRGKHNLAVFITLQTVIALLLGHEDPSTTHQYLEADLAMKEAALGRLQEPTTVETRFRPSKRMLAFLDTL